MERLPRSFFARPALTVARELLGMRLVRVDEGMRLSGVICETEVYSGEQDLGCHCKAGITPRTRVMYGPAGYAYVYFTYGMHWMLNIVADQVDFPAAVLLRALRPEEGLEVIGARREGIPPLQWTNGPGKICQALNIDKSFNGLDLCSPDSPLYIESGEPVLDASVTTGPRVGLNSVPEPWKSIPWRFLADHHSSQSQGG